MITMNIDLVYQYLKQKFPKLSQYVRCGIIDTTKSNQISVFLGSQNRVENKIAIGGLDNTVVRALPVNVVIRWGKNYKDAMATASTVYDTLLQEVNNFEFDGVKIAYIQVVDPCPIDLGRDDTGVIEYSMRLNIIYYI